jgi:hypothetical protein
LNKFIDTYLPYTLIEQPQSSITMSVQIDDEQIRRMSVTVPNIKDVASDAARAADAEKNMSLWQALKLYPKAAGWSIFLSTAIIMEVSSQLFHWQQWWRNSY